jgi:hypothetical protein
MREECKVLGELEDAYADIRLKIFARRLKGTLTPELERELAEKEDQVRRAIQDHQMEHHCEPLTEDELRAKVESLGKSLLKRGIPSQE